MEQGKVEVVKVAMVGAEVAAPGAINDTVISLSAVNEFDAEQGGRVVISGLVYSYLSVDEVTNTMTLASPLTAIIEQYDMAYMYPLAEARWALVNTPNRNDGLWCRIPDSIKDRFDDSIRDVFDQESVWIDYDADRGWTLVDLESNSNRVLGRLIDMSDADMPGSDNEPPLTTPDIQAIGGLGVVSIRLNGITNDIPVEYEYHMSDAPFSAVPGDPSTMIHLGPEASFTARTLPDGVTKLAYNKEYYFRVYPHDRDGYGPQSAQVSATTVQVSGPDVSAAYVYAGMFSFDQAVGGTMSADVTLSGMFRTAEEGQRMEMSGLGLYAFNPAGKAIFSVPTNPTDDVPIDIDAIVNARSLTVENDLEVRGLGQLAPGSVTTLSYKTSAPTSPPTVVPSYLFHEGNYSHWLNTVNSVSRGPVNEFYCGGAFGSGTITKRALDENNGGTGILISDGTEGIHSKPDSTYSAGIPRSLVEVFDSGGGSKLMVLVSPSGDSPTLWLRRYNPNTWPMGDTAGLRSCEYSFEIPMANWWWGPAIGPSHVRNEVHVAQVVGPSWTGFQIRTYNWETGALTTTRLSGTGFTDLQNENTRFVKYVASGTFGMGGTIYYMIITNHKVHFFTAGPNNTLVYVPNLAFNLADNPVNAACVEYSSTDRGAASSYVGIKSIRGLSDGFRTRIIDYTEVDRTGNIDGTSYYATAAWALKGLVGDKYITTESKPKQFTWPKRGNATLSVPSIPNAVGDLEPPDSVRFFVGKGTPSTRLNRWLQGTLAPLALVQKINSWVSTGVNGPLSNTFPEGVAARLQSNAPDPNDPASPLIDLSGDGSWRLGHLRGNSDGTNFHNTGWVQITAGSGYGHLLDDNGEVCKIDGQVFFRGRMDRLSGTGTTVGQLPDGFAPEKQISGHVRAGNAIVTFVITPGGVVLIGATGWATNDDIHLGSFTGAPYRAAT